MNKISVAYLACPYSDPDPSVRRQRVSLATWTAYELMQAGQYVYSPLTHNIPLSELGIHGNWETWQNFDHGMLARCDKLIVLKLPGWEQSKGVAAELACARRLNLPIEDLSLSPGAVPNLPGATLGELTSQLSKLFQERDWGQFHSPKNLAMNVAVEAGELMEHFRWVNESDSFFTDPKELAKVKEELGDVLINLIHLAGQLKIDPIQAAQETILKIEKKYPVEYARGKTEKYTDFPQNKETILT